VKHTCRDNVPVPDVGEKEYGKSQRKIKKKKKKKKKKNKNKTKKKKK